MFERIWELVATGLFLLSAAALVLRWLAFSGVEVPAPFSDPLPLRRGEVPDRRELLRVFWAALAFRLAWALGSLLLYHFLRGGTLTPADLSELWTRWDAQHYIKLAQLGYDGYVEDGQHLFLVFFPLYVWLVRALALVVPNTALCGMAVSFLCFAWGCVYLYRFAVEEYGSGLARRALALLWAYPFSFFFGGIMTESLFLLTTAAGLYHIRGHRWGRAALWGILAALTRMQGILLVGAAVAELFNSVKPFAFAEKNRGKAWRDVAKAIPVLCAPVLGSLGYLALNHSVTGDPFAFAEMQKHWSQGFRWFPPVLTYLAKNALTWPQVTTRWEMWIPELVLFPVTAFLLWRSWKRHRSMLTLYGFVYFILTYCLSWLLSAGRYLACGLPLFLFAADELEDRPYLSVLLTAGMMILECVFCYRYLCWGQVM